MRATLVVTDSSACIPAGLAADLGIRVVPLRIHVGDRTAVDDDAEAARVVARARAEGESLKSSAPPPTDYLSSVDDADAEAAVIITPPIEFTAMFRSASVASHLAATPAVVVDSRAATAGQALVVLAAARVAADGGGLDDVVRAAERAARRCQMVATLDALGYLGQSGRVPSPTVELARQQARREGHRSVFRIREAHVELLLAAESDDAALACILDAWRSSGGSAPEESIVVRSAGDDRAAALAARIGAPLVADLSPATSVHTGPGVIGLAWLSAPGS